jgi:His/Glu/Gln/Arg/opine family amino acid ABC transporter permease subunit
VEVPLSLKYLPFLLKGAGTTVAVSFAGLALAAGISLPVALARLSHRRLLRAPAFLYVDVIRGTPLLVQIFGVYYVLPWIGLDLSAFQAAILALGLNSGAYQAEIVRGGIQALHRGQIEAARCVGMTYLQSLRRIVLPQVILNILPALTNEASGLIKGSSLVSVLAVIELTRVGQQLVASVLRPLEIYGFVALMYLCMHLVLSQLSVKIEARLATYR